MKNQNNSLNNDKMKTENPFKKNKKQLSIFTTAGYPKIDSLEKQIKTFEENNIDFIEVGIPFSDPIADGPVIQNTSSIAIENGMNLNVLFQQLKGFKTSVPLVLMGYLNPVMNFGMERFLKECATCKVNNVILPDLSVEIYQREYQSLFEKCNISPVFLVTPKTEKSRVEKIAELCKNSFVYLVSDNATTGKSMSALSERTQSFSKIKEICSNTPLMVGFGIKNKHDIKQIHEVVDGAIIGSAYLSMVEKGTELEFLENLR